MPDHDYDAEKREEEANESQTKCPTCKKGTLRYTNDEPWIDGIVSMSCFKCDECGARFV